MLRRSIPLSLSLAASGYIGRVSGAHRLAPLVTPQRCVSGTRAGLGIATALNITVSDIIDPTTLVCVTGKKQQTTASVGLTPSRKPSMAKIIATIGPASRSSEVLEQLLESGVTVCRINLSHGTHEYHKESIDAIRGAVAKVTERHSPSVNEASGAQAASAAGQREGFFYKHVAIALDTKGPEIRTAPNDPSLGPMVLQEGQHIKVKVMQHSEGVPEKDLRNYRNSADTIYISYAPLIEQAAVGQYVLISDGQIVLRTVAIFNRGRGAHGSPSDASLQDANDPDQYLDCVVEFGGMPLRGQNNVHLPGLRIELPAMSAKDRADIAFGVAAGIDMVFASFARNKDHILEIKRELALAEERIGMPKQDMGIPVIAKIENAEGIQNIAEIAQVADGIMVARGDLGVEIPIENMFLAQRLLTARGLVTARPVICATQMLESMTAHSRPTRAEACDVANAIIDGCDTVMLSAETAAGKFPVEAARMMRKITSRADTFFNNQRLYNQILAITANEPVCDISSIASSAVLASYEMNAAFLVTTTISGNSVRLLARYRPSCPIIAVCRSLRTARSLAIVRGVFPVLNEATMAVPNAHWAEHFPELIEQGIAEGIRILNIQPREQKNVVIITNTDTSPENPFRGSMSIRSIP